MDVQEPFAEVSDLEARWRPLTGEESASADALLLDASQMIVDEAGDVAGIAAATLRRIVCAMVKRAMVVPDGIGVDSTQFGAGPFQESVKYANPMGDLYLTKAERRALGIGRGRAFEVDLMPSPSTVRADVPGYLGWLP